MSLERPVRFGEFVLCPVNQQLQTPEQEITLEPKVYEVLCYLITHHQRFVSLQELHQQCWAGRVVSDTAVRRTISKLRTALQDQTEPPLFIQSAAKRGYRWLQAPQVLHDNIVSAADTVAVSQPLIAATTISNPSATAIPQKTALLSRWQFWVSVLLLLVVTAGYIYHNLTVPVWQRAAPLRTIEGEKLSLAISPDKTAIVFSSNSLNHPGQELYWYHRASGITRQLTSGNHQIMWVLFHQDGRSLFYHDYQNGHYHLYQRPINAQGEWQGPAKALLPPQTVIFQLEQLPGQEKLLLNMGDADSMQIQQLDLTTGQLQPVTHAISAKTQDYLFALSEDGNTLAYLRAMPGQPQLLTLMERDSGKIISQRIHPNRAFRLAFVDDERLLVLDDKALQLLYLPSGQLTVLDENAIEGHFFARGLSRAIVRVAENEWLQNRLIGDVGQTLYQQGPVGDLTNRTMLVSSPNTISIFFMPDPLQFLVLEQQDQQRRLLLQQSNGDSTTLLEVANDRLSVQAVHPNGQQVLLLLNGQPQLFDIAQGSLSALPVRAQPWQRAMFDATGEAVILNTVDNGIPSSWRYQLDTKHSAVLHHGERVVAVITEQDYIVLTAEQHLVRIRDGQQQTLAVQTGQQHFGSVHVRQNMLFWGETDLKHTRIYRYDLTSGEQQQWQSDRRQMLQNFDLSADGQRWLLRHIARVDTQIYPVNSRL